ncbi:hypothetical protein, partial [Streptomyces sp. NPDC001274]
FRRFQPYQTLFRSVSGPNLNSGDLLEGLCLSADPTLSETSGRKFGFMSRQVRIDGSAETSFPARAK